VTCSDAFFLWNFTPLDLKTYTLMKQLLFAFSALISFSAMTQTWQPIGNTLGTDVIHQELYIDQSNGNLYVAYVEDDVHRVTVKKWQNNAWVTQGNANFGTGQDMYDIKIAGVAGQAPYVAVLYKNSGNYYIRPYRLNAGTWTGMGSTGYQTNQTDDWGMKTSTSGQLYLTYYNMDSNVGTQNALITLNVQNTTETQYGGDITASFAGKVDIAVDDLEQVWVSHENSTTGYVDLGTSPGYLALDAISGYASGKIVTNLVGGSTDLRYGGEIESGSPYLACRRYDIAGLTGGAYVNVYNGDVTDFDMASNATYDYFFYTIGSTNTVEKVSATGTETVLGANFCTGSGVIADPRIDIWNNRTVVSFIRNNYLRIMEINNEAVVSFGTTFDACEGVLTTAPSATITIVEDDNYNHNDLQLAAWSNTPEVDDSDVEIIGSYPEYYLQFTSGSVSTLTNAEFELEVKEYYVLTESELFYVDVVPEPEVDILLGTSSLCTNESVITLANFGSPAGGAWSGTGINSQGKFNPATSGLGTHTLIYTYYNSYGCAGSASHNIVVNPVPQVSVTTIAASCGENDGEADVSITGGTPGYSVYWSNGLDTEDLTDLHPGIYYVNVVDQNGCEATKPAAIASTGVALLASTTDVVCSGSQTGSIDLNIISGAAITSIEWSNGATTEDLTNVEAGAYEVMVTANDGCVSTGSYLVGSPDEFSFDVSTSNSSCGASDGSVSTVISGGTSPYTIQWYETSTGTEVGTDTEMLANVSAGAYHVVVTDDAGCSATHHTMVNDAGSAEINFIMLTPAGCLDDGAIDIAVNSDSPVANINWSSGQTTEDIDNLATGTYAVEVTDDEGCVAVALTNLPTASPDMNAICLVTVDTTTSTNLLVWEKPVTTQISHFNIYRETSVAGVFQFVASVPYADESVFNDTVASPMVRSWRYRLTAVNQCGQESDQSEFHKTIHLAINLDLGGEINLTWDDYEGFPIGTYDLYRYTTSTGWELIQQMPANLFSYQDTPPSAAGLDYMISVEPPSVCTSTENKAQDHNSSRSNKTANGIALPLGIEKPVATDLFSVYPNPSQGLFTLKMNAGVVDQCMILITDAQGRLVMEFAGTGASTEIDLADLENGVYTMQVLINDEVINQQLIKQ
jgi:trimeric autotransporter adhesin